MKYLKLYEEYYNNINKDISLSDIVNILKKIRYFKKMNKSFHSTTNSYKMIPITFNLNNNDILLNFTIYYEVNFDENDDIINTDISSIEISFSELVSSYFESIIKKRINSNELELLSSSFNKIGDYSGLKVKVDKHGINEKDLIKKTMNAIEFSNIAIKIFNNKFDKKNHECN